MSDSWVNMEIYCHHRLKQHHVSGFKYEPKKATKSKTVATFTFILLLVCTERNEWKKNKEVKSEKHRFGGSVRDFSFMGTLQLLRFN